MFLVLYPRVAVRWQTTTYTHTCGHLVADQPNESLDHDRKPGPGEKGHTPHIQLHDHTNFSLTRPGIKNICFSSCYGSGRSLSVASHLSVISYFLFCQLCRFLCQHALAGADL